VIASVQFKHFKALASVRRHRGDVRRLEADFPHGFGRMARGSAGLEGECLGKGIRGRVYA
jgi:hypothetical protein